MSAAESKIQIVVPQELYDRNYGDQLAEKVGSAIKGGATELNLDFISCESISSYGLAQLLKCAEEARKSGVKMTLHNVRPEIKDMFAALLFNEVLQIV